MVLDRTLQIFGVFLVLLALVDVYLTILFARSGTGLISPRLYGVEWRLLRTLSECLPGARRWLLPHSGPILLLLNLLLWAGLLVGGFALLVWPELGSAVQSSSGSTPRSFIAALYFAGYSLTTLGTGDLVPKTELFRILMVLMAGIGFSFLTLTLTYFMSVYSALVRRNRFALMLHHRTGDSGDAAAFLSRAVTAGRSSFAMQELATLQAELDDLYESHHFYPILHYFYFSETHYAMTRMLLLVLDTVSLIRSALDEVEFEHLIDSSAVESLWKSGTFTLVKLGEVLLPEGGRREEIAADELEEWESRYQSARKRLQAQGVAVRRDLQGGLKRYIELRREWNGAALAFAQHSGQNWSEIAGGTAR